MEYSIKMNLDAHCIAQIHFIHQPREFIQKEWTPLVVSYTMWIFANR